MGYMSPKLKALAISQDLIGWCNFTKGCNSTHFYNIQNFHLTMSSSYLNGSDWTKQFITKVLQITQLQWIYRNISLCVRHHSYFHNKRAQIFLTEMESLSDLAQEDVPEASRVLPEINFSELSKSHIKTQKYWTLAVQAALAAQNLEQACGVKLVLVAIEQQIRKNGMHRAPKLVGESQESEHTQTALDQFVCKCPHLSAPMSVQKSNKILQKPV